MRTMPAIEDEEVPGMVRQLFMSTCVLTLAFLIIDEVLLLLLFRTLSRQSVKCRRKQSYSQQVIDFTTQRAQSYTVTFIIFQVFIFIPRVFICLVFHKYTCGSAESFFVIPILAVATFCALKIWSHGQESRASSAKNVIIGAVCLSVRTMVVYAVLRDMLFNEMLRTSLLFVFVAMVASIRWCKEVSKIMREDTIVSINDMVDNAYHAYESANQKTRATITEANQMVDNVNDTAENPEPERKRCKLVEVGIVNYQQFSKGKLSQDEEKCKTTEACIAGIRIKVIMCND